MQLSRVSVSLMLFCTTALFSFSGHHYRKIRYNRLNGELNGTPRLLIDKSDYERSFVFQDPVCFTEDRVQIFEITDTECHQDKVKAKIRIGKLFGCSVDYLDADRMLPAEMNGLLVFISLLGGIAAFGLLGLVLGPVIMAAAISFVDAYATDRRELMATDDISPESDRRSKA